MVIVEREIKGENVHIKNTYLNHQDKLNGVFMLPFISYHQEGVARHRAEHLGYKRVNSRNNTMLSRKKGGFIHNVG